MNELRIATTLASQQPWFSLGVRPICPGVWQSVPDTDEEPNPRTQLIALIGKAPFSTEACEAARTEGMLEVITLGGATQEVWYADEQESVGAMLMSSALLRHAFEDITGHQVYSERRIRAVLVELGSSFPVILDRLVDEAVEDMMKRDDS